jgi:hypothetical protein
MCVGSHILMDFKNAYIYINKYGIILHCIDTI